MTRMVLPGFTQSFDDQGNLVSTGFTFTYLNTYNDEGDTFRYSIVDLVGSFPVVAIEGQETDNTFMIGDGQVYGAGNFQLGLYQSIFQITTDTGLTAQFIYFYIETTLDATGGPGSVEISVQIGGDDLQPIVDDIGADLFFDTIASIGPVTDPVLRRDVVIDILDLNAGTVLDEGSSGTIYYGGRADGTANDDYLVGNVREGGVRLNGRAGHDDVLGSNGDDQLIGDDGDDLLNGYDGSDTIAAGNGDDVISGGYGADSIGGGFGNDSVLGGLGDDVIGSGPGNDFVDAGGDNDTLSGGYGFDTVYGGDGDDELAGSYDDDDVIGGTGNDTMGGGTGADYMLGQEGDDDISGGIENDTLYGFTGNDILRGGPGTDLLFGGSGIDILNGGGDSDVLDGGTGSDIFLFNVFFGTGTSRIQGFENGIDVIRFLGLGSTPTAALAALSITQAAGGVQISSAGADIFLVGIARSQIDVNDFLFV